MSDTPKQFTPEAEAHPSLTLSRMHMEKGTNREH